MTARPVHDAPRQAQTAPPTPRCLDCDAPAAYELLLPNGDSFSPRPLLACELGGRGYTGRKRRLTVSDVVSAEGGRG